eukprot:GEZU01019172.1.p1 GENE.GEZU01019172.1~~GEZU01019172.1.p1  ORF type:complete len:183 (-),score=9.43 GEZU01019172.1:581-1129(-)
MSKQPTDASLFFAQSFHKAADHYERGRPSYSPEAIQTLFGETGVVDRNSANVPLIVVDVGAGTGKFTRLLKHASRPCSVTAVEPVQGMRDKCQKVLSQVFEQGGHVDFKVVEGTAESMPFIPSESVDVVFAAQCFHWFQYEQAVRDPPRAQTGRPLRFTVEQNQHGRRFRLAMGSRVPRRHS